MAAVPTISTEWITLAGMGRAFLARPKGSERAPCVINLHERFGLVAHTQDLSIRLAQAGYVAIAPDLFWRQNDPEAVARGDARVVLNDAEVVADMKAAAQALTQLEGADADRLAIVGNCQTGRYAAVFAGNHRVLGAVAFYGGVQPRDWEVNERQPEAYEQIIARIDAPFLGIFGEKDHVNSVDDVLQLRATLEKYRKSYDIRIFRDAPHGWLNHTMPGRYRPEMARAAWEITLGFLEEAFAGRDAGREVTWRFQSSVASDYDFKSNKRLE